MFTKHFILVLLSIFTKLIISAQTLPGVNFQAIARDLNGDLALSRSVLIQSSILHNNANGTVLLKEEFQVMTDNEGLFNIKIGQGKRIGGEIATITSIDWSNGPYFLNIKLAISPNKIASSNDFSTDLIDLGTSSFGAVPYAFFASGVAGLDKKLNSTDTVSMLKPYAKASNLKQLELLVNSTFDSTKILQLNASKLELKDSLTRFITPAQLSTLSQEAYAMMDLKEITANKSTDVVLDSASDTKYPTVKAIKTYVDNRSSGNNVNMVGNAATASKLASVVTINGVGFDGSSNIVIPSQPSYALTMDASGSGDLIGSIYDGSSSKIISYNTIGASPLAGSSSLTSVGTITSGVWSASTIDVTKGGTGVTTLTGLLKGNGSSAFSAAVAGVDYESAIATSTITPTVTYWRGDKTWQTLNTEVVPELTSTPTNKYFTEERVLNTKVSSLTPIHGFYSQTDNIAITIDKIIGNQYINESSGIISFGGISLASSNTFNVGAAQVFIVDNTTDINNPTSNHFEYAGATGISTPYLASSTITYVYLDNTGTLRLSGTELSPEQRRHNVLLGKLGHPDHINIISTYTQPDIIQGPLSQLRDIWQPIKLVNEGISPRANGANLNFNSTAGVLYGLGIGYGIDVNSPSSVTLAAKTPVTFQYRTQEGGVNLDVISIDPTRWDNKGVLTAISGSGARSTNQRIFLLQNGKIRVQYGQIEYATLAAAIAGIQSESFSTYAGIKEYGILIGILSVRRDATNLSDVNQARFFSVSKFGETVGATSGVVTSSLQQSYNNGSLILTDATNGAFDIRRGTASDADNVFLIQNGAGANTVSITGAGTSVLASSITASNFIQSGGTAAQFLKADGSVDATSYLVREVADEFVATGGQTVFTLSQTKSNLSKVKMYINSNRVRNAAYTITGTTVTYTPVNNYGITISANDIVQFDYYY